MTRLLEFITRHPLLVTATALAVLAAAIYETMVRARGSVGVSPREAVRLINQGATVMDMREAAVFGGGHIVDAVNVKATDVTVEKEGRLKKKRGVLLVCGNGSQSARVVASLRKSGIENAWSLSGGFSAWERENLPVVAPAKSSVQQG
jgi:rhodanese-related sulfurtransferase